MGSVITCCDDSSAATRPNNVKDQNMNVTYNQ